MKHLLKHDFGDGTYMIDIDQYDQYDIKSLYDLLTSEDLKIRIKEGNIYGEMDRDDLMGLTGAELLSVRTGNIAFQVLELRVKKLIAAGGMPYVAVRARVRPLGPYAEKFHHFLHISSNYRISMRALVVTLALPGMRGTVRLIPGNVIAWYVEERQSQRLQRIADKLQVVPDKFGFHGKPVKVCSYYSPFPDHVVKEYMDADCRIIKRCRSGLVQIARVQDIGNNRSLKRSISLPQSILSVG